MNKGTSMAEKINDYYRIIWNSSGIHTPVITKKQLLNEIEMSLIHLNGVNELSLNIIQFNMTEDQFNNRPADLKNYGFEGTVN